MSRIDGGDFAWAAEQARRALEAAQADAQRQADLERAKTLAAAVAPALDPQNPQGPEALGRLLAELQRLAAEARAAFTVEVARRLGPAAGPEATATATTAADAAGFFEAVVNRSCPPGTDRRTSLGRTLLAAVGARPAGVGERVLETAISQALFSLKAAAGSKTAAAPQRDRLERAPSRLVSSRDRMIQDGTLGDLQAPTGPETARGRDGAAETSSAPTGSSPLATPALAPAPESPPVVLERADVARRVDVAADLEALSAALGPSRGLEAPPAVASATSVVSHGRILGVEKVGWAEAAPALVRTPLRGVVFRLATIGGKAEAVRAALLGAEGGTLIERLALGEAAGLVSRVALHAGAGVALLAPERGPREALRAIAAARAEVQEVHASAKDALATLGPLSGHFRGLMGSVNEIREVERLSRQSESELRATAGRGALLETVDAGASAYTSGPEAEGAGVLTEEDLARLGSALDPGKPPPQIAWTEELVNATCDLGREQGGVSDADGARHLELARMALGSETEGPTRPLEAPDLAAVLKLTGIPLEKVDPNQLASAASYVSSATTQADQQEKLRKALDSFQVLSTMGAPRLTRQQMVDQLWAMAKVPGHALQKLSDGEIQRKYQEVASALNAGPGPAQIKIGGYNLKLELGEAGQVLSTSCKKPGFFSKLWGVVKKVAPVALTVASFVFTGGTATALIRLGQGLLGAVDAIKSKSLLAMATAGASILGAGASLFKKGAGLAGRISTVATNVARGLQGVSRMRSGDFLGGLANIGQAIAGGIGGTASAGQKGLLGVAEKLRYFSTKLSAVASGVSAARGYSSASRGLDEARRSLAAARASGDPRLVAEAEKRLREAERARRSAVLGAASGAFDAASLWVGDRGRFAGAPALEPFGPGAASRLQLLGQGLGVARDVSAGDYMSAAVGGLQAASNLDAARKEGASSTLTDAARMAEAGLGYYRSQRGLSSAQKTVEEAEALLVSARAQGDPALVEKAEGELRQARRGLESAAMGGLAAGESLIATAQSVAKGRAKRPFENALRRARPLLEDAQATADRLEETLLCTVDLPEPLAKRLTEEKKRLEEAGADFAAELREAKGDPEKEAAAERRYRQTVTQIGERHEQVLRILAAVQSAQARASAPGASSARPSPAPSSLTIPAAGEGGAGSASPQPGLVGRVVIGEGLTLWAVSMLSGVSVEDLRAYNASVGNPLPADNELPIGGSLYVPEGEGWRTSTPRTPAEVESMIREANRRGQGLVPPGGLGDPGLGPSGKVLPQLRVSEVLDIPPPGERSSALRALEQDFKKIDEDIERSEFRFGDPSTWFDTKTDDAKNEARDRYKEAAERYRDLLSDDLSTDDQRRAAAEELLRARNDFDLARGIVERQAASADYLTPVTELVQLGQDALHDQGEKQRQLLVDRLTEAGLPPALVGLVTLPGELTDNTADALAGLLKSPVYVADDIAGMIAHPVDTVTGLLQLGLRIEDATYSGRAFRFLLEAATGKYDSLDEAEEAFLDQMNPLSLLDAQSQLVLDLGRGALGQSIDLAKEGKWAEAMGTLVGTNVNWGAAIGGLRGVRRLRAAIEAEAEIQKAARAATEGTQAAREAGTLPQGAGAFGQVPSLEARIPYPDKWVRGGGKISYHPDGTFTYVSKSGVGVTYSARGFPDFHPYLYKGSEGLAEVRIRLTGNRLADETAANAAAGFQHTPRGYTWHHHEDLGLMQLVETRVHRAFWHEGGFSLSRKWGQ
jgi:hypothetical protein